MWMNILAENTLIRLEDRQITYSDATWINFANKHKNTSTACLTEYLTVVGKHERMSSATLWLSTPEMKSQKTFSFQTTLLQVKTQFQLQFPKYHRLTKKMSQPAEIF
jgi:hypothetical protein